MTDKPNIVFILTDNVGYGVPSSYNGGILGTPTARIDKLAAEGLRLTNFNVENQCTPSAPKRYSTLWIAASRGYVQPPRFFVSHLHLSRY